MSDTGGQPNILIIVVDQQRFDTIHALGASHMLTPHLDWLVDEGITFTRAYSDCPVCVPARATLMTGKHGHSLDCVSNQKNRTPLAENATLPGLLTAHGYQTRAQGRTHFIPEGKRYGFEEMEPPSVWERACREDPAIGTAHLTGLGANEVVPGISGLPVSRTLTRWVVERSIDFLENRDETRPFFLWSGFSDPHPPFTPCRDYWELYRDRQLPSAAEGAWSERVAATAPGWLQPTWALSDYTRMDGPQVDASRRAYYALVTQVDYALGLLFGALREHGLLESTWIIFTSDHGEMLGDHHMGSKLTFFEGSCHVPMIVRPPAPAWPVPEHAGSRCDRLTTLADVMPTCLAAAGVDIPADVDGRDLMTKATGPSERDRAMVGDCQHRFFAVIDGRWKYQWTALGGSELLFDLGADPREERDLAGDPEHAVRLAEMRGRLINHLEAQASGRVERGRLVAGTVPKGRNEVARFPGSPTTSNTEHRTTRPMGSNR